MSQQTPEKLGKVQYLARDLKNNCTNSLAYLRDLESVHAETKQLAEKALPNCLAAVLRDAAEIAEAVPALRRIASGQEPRQEVTDLGMAIQVRYAPPTNSRGGKWFATLWRDSETIFRASHSFTFNDSDNEGADLAASKCLEKFTAYCNSGDSVSHLSKVAFRLVGRCSLGNGIYAYTFKRFTA